MSVEERTPSTSEAGARSGRLQPAPSGRFLHDVVSWSNWADGAFSAHPSLRARSRAVHHRLALARRHGLRPYGAQRLTSLQLAGLLHEVGRLITRDDTTRHHLTGARFVESIGMHDVACLIAHLGGDPLARPGATGAIGAIDADLWRNVDRDLLAILSYVEITTDPEGATISVPEHRAALVARHGVASVEVATFERRVPEALEGQRLLTSGRVRHAF